MAASIGLIGPNATALAVADHAAEAGSASAVLGLAQFVIGGVEAPLAGLGGSRAEAPMMAAIGAASLGAAVSFALLARGAVAPAGAPAARGRQGPGGGGRR